MSSTARRGRTPDSHLFPTRPYDLVREFVIAAITMVVLTVALAAVFSSPDEHAITLSAWAKAAPADVIATATAELAGTTTSAGYGAPYNTAAEGQKLGPLALQRWAGVRIPVDSANDLVISPLRQAAAGDQTLTTALATWTSAPAAQQASWAGDYSDALAEAPDSDPAKVAAGSYGPVPQLAASYLSLARTGALQSELTSGAFYPTDQTKPLLLLADGAYLEDQARAEHLGGDQWGMMNETGNYPGQPWMWLYTFWYQIPPFSTSGNADALVWGVMAVLTLGLILLPFIPGLRALPRHLGVHKLIWRTSR
ncbi:MAG: hypothetical protein BGO26_13615 [Actinobacteria bacterium 69-20]|nr:hypothetical protein [Actinomycetota bacterium]OJV27623.1 MAG: hypothetical protein BGO26_13615 [Actinobacteria bacterium 69-20]